MEALIEEMKSQIENSGIDPNSITSTSEFLFG